MRKIISIVFFVLSGIVIQAQPFVDVAAFRHNYYGITDYKENAATLSSSSNIAELFFPAKLKSGDMLLFGVDGYHHHFYSPGTYQNDQDLLATSLQLGMVHPFGKDKKFKFTGVLVPKISSDFKEIRQNDLQLGGLFLFTYVRKASLKLKLGMYYNREFFGNYFMPLAGIDWKMSPKSYVFGVVPGNLHYEYNIMKSLYFQASYRSYTASYRLGKIYGDNYVREGGNFFGDTQFSGVFSWYPVKMLSLYAGGGYTFYRWFRSESSMNVPANLVPVDYINSFPNLYTKTKNHWFITFGAAFRVRLDKDYEEKK